MSGNKGTHDTEYYIYTSSLTLTALSYITNFVIQSQCKCPLYTVPIPMNIYNTTLTWPPTIAHQMLPYTSMSRFSCVCVQSQLRLHIGHSIAAYESEQWWVLQHSLPHLYISRQIEVLQAVPSGE